MTFTEFAQTREPAYIVGLYMGYNLNYIQQLSDFWTFLLLSVLAHLVSDYKREAP